MTDSQICQWMQIIKSNHSNFKKVNSLVFSVIINKSRSWNEINKKNPPFFLLRYKYIRTILMNIHSMDLAHAHLMYCNRENK